MRYLLLIGLLALLRIGHAQPLIKGYYFSRVGLTFLIVSADARSGGMGELGVATLPDAYSHQHNAAKYLFMDSRHRSSVNFFYVPWLRQLVDDMSIAGEIG